MASVRGIVRVARLNLASQPLEGALVRLAPMDASGPAIDTKSSGQGQFEFLDVPPGWYILSVWSAYRETVRAIQVVNGANEVGSIDVRFIVCFDEPSITCELPGAEACIRAFTPVLTVCEAFKGDLGAPCHRPIVIVGIFKSGTDETLRLDCPEQLVSGDVGWPSAIGLTRPSPPPEALRDEIEKKRQEVIKSSPPEAPLRPERVVGLYGFFVSVAGLTSAACCKAPVETVRPPGRLFGVTELDRWIIR